MWLLPRDLSINSSGNIEPSQIAMDDQAASTTTVDDQTATTHTVNTTTASSPKTKSKSKLWTKNKRDHFCCYQPNSARHNNTTLCKQWTTVTNHTIQISTATGIYIKIVLFNLHTKKGEEFRTSDHPENTFHNNPEPSPVIQLPPTHSPFKGLHLPQPLIQHQQLISTSSSISVPASSTLKQIISSTITTSSSTSQAIPKKSLDTTLPGGSLKIIKNLTTKKKLNKSKSAAKSKTAKKQQPGTNSELKSKMKEIVNKTDLNNERSKQQRKSKRVCGGCSMM